MLPTTSTARTGRHLLKRLMYAQLSVLEAGKILLDKQQPLVPFTVKAEPASVYYNFRIKPEALTAFSRYINLPSDFAITPIRCLQDEPSHYLLTLNVYEVSGIASGVRAEWSTYIRDPDGTPRYMVLEARSSTRSMDPVDVITPKSRVSHHSDNNSTQTTVTSMQGGLFEARYTVPTDALPARLDRQWVSANDFIYWRNGICDRVFYDSGMAFADALLIDPGLAIIDDQTHWAAFIETPAQHIVQFKQAIEFVIMPWHNVASAAR